MALGVIDLKQRVLYLNKPSDLPTSTVPKMFTHFAPNLLTIPKPTKALLGSRSSTDVGNDDERGRTDPMMLLRERIIFLGKPK